jgi:dienelactone hydrolase
LLILVTDIFGETSWCKTLLQTWQQKGHNTFCISPYEENDGLTNFENEQQAYQAFQDAGDLQAYVNKLKLCLAQLNISNEQAINCIGFSAGAAALWQVVSTKLNTNSHLCINHCIGFYPGQIRHSLDLTPSCPFTIVFPKEEDHFDLPKVIQHLVTKQNLRIVQVPLKHGYVNPQSVNYDMTASDQVTDMLVNVECINQPSVFIPSLIQQNKMHEERTCSLPS